MRWIIIIVSLFMAQAAFADVPQRVQAAAQAGFARMPDVVIVDRITDHCGARDTIAAVAYCTTENRILVTRAAQPGPEVSYLVAHAYGHAVQVQHGVADAALAAIRSRRAEEVKLRGWVERQVDCIAGFVVARAGLPMPDIASLGPGDPLDRPHWGRAPLHRGPHVPVPVAERVAWFSSGYRRGLAACAVGEFTAELLLAALRR